MKSKFNIIVLFLFLFLLIGLFNTKVCFTQNNQYLVNPSFYKSYKQITYQGLPIEIRKIMKDAKCGEIGADPSPSNDYKTNYDEGFAIDLNDDKVLEYIFCCEAPPHGPCQGKIYSLIDGKWTIILNDFPVYEVVKPIDAIKVLSTKSGMFHDLSRSDILSTRDVTVKFINGKYFPIYYPDEVVEQIMFHMSHHSNSIDGCYAGLTDNESNVLKTINLRYSENSKIFFALESKEKADTVMNILLSKGMHLNSNSSTGQIIFCITNDPK